MWDCRWPSEVRRTHLRVGVAGHLADDPSAPTWAGFFIFRYHPDQSVGDRIRLDARSRIAVLLRDASPNHRLFRFVLVLPVLAIPAVVSTTFRLSSAREDTPTVVRLTPISEDPAATSIPSGGPVPVTTARLATASPAASSVSVSSRVGAAASSRTWATVPITLSSTFCQRVQNGSLVFRTAVRSEPSICCLFG